LHPVNEFRQGGFQQVGALVTDCREALQREVIPVDTHVRQIAIKHYGLRGSSSTKANMTSKLYDEVNLKLAMIWGEYAGWAHSVLFTADLKAFSSYGLPSPSPSTIDDSLRKETITPAPTPPLTPSPSSAKRKMGNREGPFATNMVTKGEQVHDTTIDQVKKRRRVVMIQKP